MTFSHFGFRSSNQYGKSSMEKSCLTVLLWEIQIVLLCWVAFGENGSGECSHPDDWFSDSFLESDCDC